jgi:hypothetical protein
MQQRPHRCPDCAEGAFVGNGRCSRSNGTGINVNVASAVPECPACAGSGVCATCGGAGVYPPPQDEQSIQKLFE